MPALDTLVKLGVGSYKTRTGRFHIYQPYDGLPDEGSANPIEKWIVVDNLEGGRYTFKSLREAKIWLVENRLE